tara:strand:+ start:111 stop:272 length:162 start_codon:yes stop_codon:yes gene_type:complete
MLKDKWGAIIISWLVAIFILMPLRQASPVIFNSVCAVLLWVAIYRLYIKKDNG